MENQTAESQVLPELEQLFTDEVKPSCDINSVLERSSLKIELVN